MKNSRSMKRYGPGGNLYLVNGIANARLRTSELFHAKASFLVWTLEFEDAHAVSVVGDAAGFEMRHCCTS